MSCATWFQEAGSGEAWPAVSGAGELSGVEEGSLLSEIISAGGSAGSGAETISEAGTSDSTFGTSDSEPMAATATAATSPSAGV